MVMFASKRIQGMNLSEANKLKRRAIILELYEAEKSYVDSLRALVTNYYLPLKEKKLISLQNLNDIFYKIPEIHVHHQLFLFSYKKKVEHWTDQETVGEIIYNAFTKSSLSDTYIGYIVNFPKSQEVLKSCKEMQSFSRFIEQQAKDNNRKLAIIDLLIQPVQRIPRYELFLKDLIKQTAPAHADAPLLRKALDCVHSLAISIDEAKDARSDAEPEISIEDMINTVFLETAETGSPNMAARIQYSINGEKRRDGNIFLIRQYLILTTNKRKGGLLSKKPSFNEKSSELSDVQFVKREHSLKLKEKIEDLQCEVMGAVAYQSLLSKYHCICDNAILNQIEEMLLRLSRQDDDLLNDIRVLISRNENVVSGEAKVEAIKDAVVRMVLTLKNSTKIIVWFANPEERQNWVSALLDLKPQNRDGLDSYNGHSPDQSNNRFSKNFDSEKHKATAMVNVKRKTKSSFDSGSISGIPMFFKNHHAI